jgi:hypothetical protein
VATATDSTAVNFGFPDRSRYVSFKLLLSYPPEADWTPFQTHYFSENPETPGVELWIPGSVASNCDRKITEAVGQARGLSSFPPATFANQGPLVSALPVTANTCKFVLVFEMCHRVIIPHFGLVNVDVKNKTVVL